MKTKLVYILVSDTSDFYYEQTLLSATSARMWNPDAEIIVVVDDKTNATLVGTRTALMDVANKKVVVDFPKDINKKRRSRFLKTSVRKYVEGDFLYIDSDTVVCQSLEEIDNLTIEMGAVPDSHSTSNPEETVLQRIGLLDCTFKEGDSYYNSGILYVKDTPETHAFFEEWYNIYNQSLNKKLDFDQPALYVCNQRRDLIKPLEGEFNCQIFTGGLPYLGYAKIIHAFNTYSFNAYFGGCFFIFADNSYLNTIKQRGRVDEKDLHLLKNAKRQFYGEYALTYGQNLEYNKSVLFHIFLDHRSLFHKIEFIGKVFLKLSRMFGK